MASSTPFDGTNFLTGAPDLNQPHGNDYLEHQSTRKSMEFINNKEHEVLVNPMSTSAGGGVHKNGSSVAYFTSTAPTLRPDGLTALADNDVDKGRVWFDSTFDPPAMMKWNGSSWVQAGNKVLNGTYYTSVNEADDGTVDLIKAGRNEADDADVMVISDGARTDTNSAPDEDTGVANKKYVDDQNVSQAGQIKGWAEVTGANGNLVNGYNVSSSSRTSTGIYVINWDTDFAGVGYSPQLSVRHATSQIVAQFTAQAAGSVTVTCWSRATGSVIDPTEVYVWAIGSQT